MNRQTGIIATVAAAILCGCPGLGACLWGAIFGLGGAAGTGTVTLGTETSALDPTTALATGAGVICLGIILVLIPVAVGFFTLRQKPASSG